MSKIGIIKDITEIKSKTKRTTPNVSNKKNKTVNKEIFCTTILQTKTF